MKEMMTTAPTDCGKDLKYVNLHVDQIRRLELTLICAPIEIKYLEN